MKGLRKYLTPFAPDQSGAVSVLYELGGIIVICDAGGCAGNVCGFDEPRWFSHKSAVFSAGLRDMDAILGRDDRLVEKLRDVAGKLDANFAAIIGTPVPSVIATDYQALRRMAQRNISLPVITIDTTGMALYDEGAEKAYLALVKQFSSERYPVEPGRIGIFGATPLDFSRLSVEAAFQSAFGSEQNLCCYGMGSGLSALETASAAEKNIVVSPSGMKAAEYLYQTFGTPYEILDPLAPSLLPKTDVAGKRVLVVHQQVRTDSLRKLLEQRGASVTVGTWFHSLPELTRPGDLFFAEEDDFTQAVESGGYDILMTDTALWGAAPRFHGIKIDLPHFAVSGRLETS